MSDFGAAGEAMDNVIAFITGFRTKIKAAIPDIGTEALDEMTVMYLERLFKSS